MHSTQSSHGLRDQTIARLEAICHRPPPATFPAPEVPSAKGMRSFYYEGLPLQGKPTRVFAMCGVPTHASHEHKVPGIVLVHGGSGTAYADWVRLWTERGYAALAMDHDGGIPIGETGNWQAATQGGPRFEEVTQMTKSVDEQWMYHAVADAILANTLLRSFPEVDAQRIGIAGISWGGVITAITIGIDQRFCFASSVYGCGFISTQTDDGSCFVGKDSPSDMREHWFRLWDPAHYLPRSKTPLQWINGTNDFAFTLCALAQSANASNSTNTMSIRLNMPHGHGGAGESPPEIQTFADSITGTALPMVTITGSGTASNGSAWVGYSCPVGVTIESCHLFWTTDTCRWQDRQWHSEMITATSNRATVTTHLPDAITCFFFTLTDSRSLSVSSSPQITDGNRPAAMQ